jgi:hypothetical protein
MNRIQIEMSDERVSELEALMEKCGIRTKKDLVNTALTLFKWAVQEKEKGWTVA